MRCILFITVFFTCAFSKAQVNYVLNPSFEIYTECSYQFDQINFANHWSGIDTTSTMGSAYCIPEFCHTCDTGMGSVPQNIFYYQYPRTGNGMAMMIMSYDESDPLSPVKRDYLQGRLTSLLTDGQSYCVSFYVCQAEMSENNIDRMGAYLDDGNIDTTDTCALPLTQYHPQIETGNIVDDTLNWTKIEGVFTSDGSEHFITIGNFYPLDSLNKTDRNTGFHWSYYLVDDVSVIPSDLPAYAGGDTWVALGDSVFIGRTPEVGLECKWYVGGNVVDSGGGIWVHPTVNTTYVVEQTLCGLVKTDTVNVSVFHTSINGMTNSKQLSIYPNPASTELTVYMDKMVFSEAIIVNSLGQQMLQNNILSKETKIDISSLPSGVYYLQLNGEKGREIRSFVKM